MWQAVAAIGGFIIFQKMILWIWRLLCFKYEWARRFDFNARYRKGWLPPPQETDPNSPLMRIADVLESIHRNLQFADLTGEPLVHIRQPGIQASMLRDEPSPPDRETDTAEADGSAA